MAQREEVIRRTVYVSDIDHQGNPTPSRIRWSPSGQEACTRAGLIHVCMRHLQGSFPIEVHNEPVLLQWLCSCSGKLWADFTEAQMSGLQLEAPDILAPLLFEPQPEVCFFLCNVLVEALSRFAFGHNKNLKSVAVANWKPQSKSVLTSLPSFLIKGAGSVHTTPSRYMSQGSIVSSTVSPLLGDSDSGILNDCVSKGGLNHTRPRPLENTFYLKCVLAIYTLAKDPSPHVASLGQRVLSTIGIEQVVAKSVKSSGESVRPVESTSTPNPRLAGLAHSSSCFSRPFSADIQNPPVSPSRSSYLEMRRVCSPELRPRLMNSPDSGLADLRLVGTQFGTGTKAALLQPFLPVVIAADEKERIRRWTYPDLERLHVKGASEISYCIFFSSG
ncbi:unnamed protein product [Fraxinus pennsylvanica]|uniref:Uncharacterized protein n=1 Tax=Fraxinus pennsylvanica TaxID=56036 RepID=A0AAD2A085_9LAMI|nr:unnamed protein product [Fraxinus pennsylvanica]